MVALLVLAAAGCASPTPAAIPDGNAPEHRAAVPAGTLTLSVVPAGYALQAIARRWLTTDIYEYAVTLQYWNGTSFTDFDPALTVVLPQKVEVPKQQAMFSHLKQGSKYRAVLVIKGNAGGTAPTYVLNAAEAVTQVFDLTADQDVQEAQAATLVGQLDAVPFSGNATVDADNLPAGTTDLEAVLKASVSGTTLCTISYPVTQQASFSSLKAGTGYQVVLTAKQDGATLATASSTSFSWDPAATSLDSEQSVTVIF